MPKVEPHRLSATGLVRHLEGGELTIEAVLRSCLERIAEREPVVRAWSWLAEEAALTRARDLDRAKQKTLLAGVPFAIKDIFDTADMPTTYGSPIYVGWRPASDASAAALPKARAASCSARRSRPNSPIGTRVRQAIHTIPISVREALRADRRRRSPTSWCRWPSARRLGAQ